MKKFTFLTLIVLLVPFVKAQNSFPTAKNSNVKIDGGYINLIQPVTTGGWARGFLNRQTDMTIFSGVGLYGISNTPKYLYFAHGTSPWSSGLGLYVKTNGNVGIGTTNPNSKLDVNGGINVSGSNSIPSVNGFRNMLQFTSASHAALVYNSGQNNELMFGFHSNGNFYWGTGRSANSPDYYSMYLNGNNGNLGIRGKLTASEVEVKIGGWSDFVFEPNYHLISLEDLEQYIKQNKHLPDVPSAEEVKENGLSLGQSDAILLQKIEELTLYMIEQNKRLNKVEAENKELKSENIELKKINNKLIELENKIEKLELNK